MSDHVVVVVWFSGENVLFEHDVVHKTAHFEVVFDGIDKVIGSFLICKLFFGREVFREVSIGALGMCDLDGREVIDEGGE